MTLTELSVEYRAHADALSGRIHQLEFSLSQTEDSAERCQLQDRIRMLSTMLREARELAVLLEHYYDKSHHLNGKYQI